MLRQPGPNAFHDTVYGIIISEGIMMGQRNPLRSRMLPNSYRIFHGTMPPANLGRVLFGSVLRIMDEKIRSLKEVSVPAILPCDFTLARCECSRIGFVVTGIHERCPVDLQPIPQRERRMVEVTGRDPDIVDVESTLDKIMVVDRGSKLIERDGEICVLHLPGQCFAQGLAKAFRAVNIPFVTGRENRSEERQALDMIPMGMTDQDVAAHAFQAGRHEFLAEGVGSGSAIKDNECASCRAHLNA